MTGAVKIVLTVIAALLLVASLLLVGNTIRLSIYARRREVEVMRLVGATNWFIRWPFMIEGVIVGFSGAALAVGILWLGKVTDRRSARRATSRSRQLLDRSASRPWSRSCSPPRCWSRRSAAASRCAASCGSERPDLSVPLERRPLLAASHERRARRGFVVGSGGRGPAELPQRCAYAFVDDRPSADRRGARGDRGQLLPAGRRAELDNASIDGMVDGCGSATTTASRTTSTRGPRSSFDAATSGRFSGVGLTVSEVKRGLRVASVIPDTPAAQAGMKRAT